MTTRVAILAKYLNRDGSPWLVDDLADALLAADVQVDVYHYDFLKEPTPPLAKAATTYRRVPFAFGYTGPGRSAVGLVSQFVMLVRFLGPLLTGRYDKVLGFTSFGLLAPIMTIMSRFTSAETVGIVWDFYPVQRDQSGISHAGTFASRVTYWLEASEANSLDRALVMTPDNGRYFAKYFPASDASIELNYLWRTPPPTRPDAGSVDHHGLDPTRPRVVFGGAFSAGRELDVLLDAAHELEQGSRCPDVILIGGGVNDEPLKQSISDRGLRHVHVLARLPRDDYQEFVATCAIGLVVTSGTVDSPSFPSKILDYMAASIPVVVAANPATDLGGIVEESFECGVAVDVGDPVQLANQIRRLIDDPDYASRLGGNGHRTLTEQLTPAAVASRILNEDTVAVASADGKVRPKAQDATLNSDR